MALATATLAASGFTRMADQFDQASERETLDREFAIKTALATSRAGILNPKGHCYNCHEPLPKGGLFCDRDCSADHELRARTQRF